MLAYAPRSDQRRLRPGALAIIIGAHAVAVGLVMTAKMNVAPTWDPAVTEVDLIREPKPPEPVPPEPRRNPVPRDSRLDTPPAPTPIPSEGPTVAPTPVPIPNPGPTIGPGVEPSPTPLPIPTPPIASTGPRFKTPDSAIRPPYPPGKRELDQEATLRLRLSIDANGRVTAVEPVGRADAAFLEAARRHILKAWRYEPATEAGRSVASTTVVTLKFELN